jgi:hypothetical protein
LEGQEVLLLVAAAAAPAVSDVDQMLVVEVVEAEAVDLLGVVSVHVEKDVWGQVRTHLYM